MVRKFKEKSESESVSFGDSYRELSDLLLESEVPIDLTSFDDFVQEHGPKSFPQYNFRSWHIHYLCNKVDNLIASKDSKYLLAVLPRYHLKSTVLGNFFSIYRILTSFGEGLFISYKEELASIHLYHTKEIVRSNKNLSSFMKDLSPQSDNMINYKIGNKRCKIYPSGIFGVKRGLHTDLITCADDLMGDLQNPMTYTEIDKAIRIFDAEILNIPNKGCPLVVYGTVISDNDLLFHLKRKSSFQEHLIWMPAINPDSDHEVLWEEMYDREWLEQRKVDGGWKAFSTEFLLVPVHSTEAFFNREQLDKVIDKNLVNYQVPGM